MLKDDRQFKDPAAARAYVRNLTYLFDDAEEMVEFLSACDIVQATLVRWLFQKNRYERLRRCTWRREPQADQAEKEVARCEYGKASAEFQLAKESLKRIIRKLDGARGDRELPGG